MTSRFTPRVRRVHCSVQGPLRPTMVKAECCMHHSTYCDGDQTADTMASQQKQESVQQISQTPSSSDTGRLRPSSPSIRSTWTSPRHGQCGEDQGSRVAKPRRASTIGMMNWDKSDHLCDGARRLTKPQRQGCFQQTVSARVPEVDAFCWITFGAEQIQVVRCDGRH